MGNWRKDNEARLAFFVDIIVYLIPDFIRILVINICLYSILRQFEEFYGQKNIEQQCSEEDLMNLHEVFMVRLRTVLLA